MPHMTTSNTAVTAMPVIYGFIHHLSFQNKCYFFNSVYATSFLDTPNAVQTVHALFGNGHRGRPVCNLNLHFLYCLHIFYNVPFFAYIPFENLQRFRMPLYFSCVMLIYLRTVVLFCKMLVSDLQNVFIWFDDDCLQIEH